MELEALALGAGMTTHGSTELYQRCVQRYGMYLGVAKPDSGLSTRRLGIFSRVTVHTRIIPLCGRESPY